MINMNWLRELTADLGFMPATTDEADIERHRRHNKNADYWLALPVTLCTLVMAELWCLHGAPIHVLTVNA
jgi:hypothetical protein